MANNIETMESAVKSQALKVMKSAKKQLQYETKELARVEKELEIKIKALDKIKETMLVQGNDINEQYEDKTKKLENDVIDLQKEYAMIKETIEALKYNFEK